MKRMVQWLVAGTFTLGAAPALWAVSSDVDILLNTLVQKGILTEGDAVQIRQEIADTKGPRTQQLAKEVVPAWAQRITISGDMRLRSEHIWRDETTSATKTRNRYRGRLRVGAKANISEQVEAGFRLATGTDTDPIGPNQSATDSFDKKNLFIDQAYVKLTTAHTAFEAVPLTFWGGKFESPFYSSSLVWDPDVTFEGAALALTPAAGPVTGWLTGGVFPIEEISAKGGDPTLWGSQAGASWAVAPDADAPWLKALTVKGSLSYYDFANLENGIDVHESSTFGNSGTVSGAAAPFTFRPAAGVDYDELDLNGEVTSELLGKPVRLHADYVKNTAISDNDEGFQIGAKFGKADKPLAWEAGYDYQRLEPDAVLGVFTDSDFGVGGANRSGHVYYATLGTLKNSTLGVKWFVTEAATGTAAAADRLQVDWLTKF